MSKRLAGWSVCFLLPLLPFSAAGQSPGQIFTDVPPGSAIYDATSTLYQLLVTQGCSTSPPKFCPSDTLQRQDMAAFIVRSWSIRIWNDPEAFATKAPIYSNAYFADVPTGSPQFAYIQKLYELGITSGYTAPVVSGGHLVTQGIFCPNPTDNGYSQTICANSWSLDNYQIAVFAARARALSDIGCNAQYTGIAEPYMTSTNPSCTPNNFAWTTTPYFTDVPASDTYFKYIQRLGDLGAYTGVYTPTPYAGCGNCTFGEMNLVTRGNMAIETVAGIGLDPRTTLTFNGTTGPNYTSTAAAITVPFYYYHQDKAYGANDVSYAQFALADSGGTFHCYGDWGRTNALYLYDGNTGVTNGFGIDQADSFCTISLVSITNSLTDPTAVTVVLNFVFNQGFGQTFTVMSQMDYASGYQTPSFENVGSLTVQQPSGPTVELSVAGKTGVDYQVGDTFTVTVNAPNQPGAQIAVVQNGGPLTNIPGWVTNTQGVYTSPPTTWGIGNVGNYAQTYYVAGNMAVPGLSFQVANGSGTYTCGPVNPQFSNLPVAPGTPVQVSANVSGITNLNPASVSFLIGGNNTNAYQASIPASLAPPSSWSGTINTTGLLGTYAVTPVITPTLGGAATYCTNAVGFFQVAATNTPGTPPPVSCASMTGTWTDRLQQNNPTFTWVLTDNNGMIGGTASDVGACGINFNYGTISGTYSHTTGQYNVTASNGSPPSFTCNGTSYSTADQNITGSTQGQSCGFGTGTHTGIGSGISVGDTMTIERIPSGEVTSTPNPAWGTSYGYATTAIFNVALQSPTGTNYNFGGRSVQEVIPAPNQIPPGYAGSDGCYWAGAPWMAPITSLAGQDTWGVQSSGQNGSYGPDYVGLNDTWVAYAQKHAPALGSPGSSCTIKYPQMMMITKESVAQPSAPKVGQAEAYGTPGFGFNLIQFTIYSNAIQIGRGSAMVLQEFQF